MSSSEKRIAANRRNARKSTGARTAVGKNHSRMNALTHAIYADPKNLPGEDPQQASELVKQMREQLQPQGAMEVAVVDHIISLIQELRRISRAYDVHFAALIKRQAVLRLRHRAIKKLEYDLHTGTFLDSWHVNQDIERIHATTKPQVQAKDFECALDVTISDETEVSVAVNVDRRKRQLIRDLDHAYVLIRDLQAERQPKVTVLPPVSHEDRTTEGTRIGLPQPFGLRPPANNTDKDDDGSENA